MANDLTVQTGNGKLNIRVAVWIEQHNQILVSTFPDGTISLPGGRIKFGETSLEAIAREMREETGESLSNPTLFAVIENFFHAKGVFHEFLFIYTGSIRKREIYEGTDKNSQVIAWVDIEKIDDLKPHCMKELVNHTISQGTLHLVNRD